MDAYSATQENPNKSLKDRRRGIKKGIYILPSLFTTASLFCGFYSIIHSINGDFLLAAWAIMFAGVFDAMDGRVARLTKSETEFGLEYDSLVDAASFCLAPAILAYTWSLHVLGRFGWAAAFLFFACGTLRLARFNVQVAGVEKRYFQGLPTPAAAYTMASYVILHARMGGDPEISSYFVLPMIITLALLMVSSVRYWSFKRIDFSKPKSFVFLVMAAVALFIIASAPQETMFFASLIYVLSGLLMELLHLRNRKTFLEKRLAQKEAQVLRPQERLKVVSLPEGGENRDEKRL